MNINRIKIPQWIAIIAFFHILFLIFEVFFWKIVSVRLYEYISNEELDFGSDMIKLVSILFQNQGIYNGFLAAGLIWSVLRWDDTSSAGGRQLAAFFLSCVVIAGLFGFFTVNYAPVFLVQAVPAGIVLVVLLFQGIKVPEGKTLID